MLGHANAVAWVRIWVSSWHGSISVIRCTFPRLVDSSSTRPSTSFAISAVSGAPAHSTTWYSLGSSRTARRKYGRPFWRVMRPTNTTVGASGSMPREVRAEVSGFGAHWSMSMPLWTTWTVAGSTDG